MLSDAELMKISISDLNNVSISLEDRYRALLELLELVEPLDNANGIAISLSMFICFLLVLNASLFWIWCRLLVQFIILIRDSNVCQIWTNLVGFMLSRNNLITLIRVLGLLLHGFLEKPVKTIQLFSNRYVVAVMIYRILASCC